MPSSKQEIRLADRTDRWRFVCPRGHRSWEPTNFHFWCQQCASNWADVDPEFDELHDRKTGKMVSRSELTLSPGEVDETPENGGGHA
ncbi:hypothetical protein ACLI4Q_15145 [Natrialbaceae archaeon A-CW1-1]